MTDMNPGSLPEQQAFLRNRMDKCYKVSLISNQAVIPPFCTCCMKPTATTEAVNFSVSQNAAAQTVSINLPICPACLAHRKKAKRANWLLFGISSLAALISVVLFAFFIPTAQIYFWIFPLLIAAVVYVLLGLLLKLPKLGDEHSAMRKSAWISGIDLQNRTLQFAFTNWFYANQFAKANAAYIAEEPSRNHAKHRSYLQAADHFAGFGALTLVFTAALLLIFGNNLAAIPTSLLVSKSSAASSQMISSTAASSVPASSIPASSAAVSSKASSVRSSAASSKTTSSKTTSPKPASSAPESVVVPSSVPVSSISSSIVTSSKVSSVSPSSIAASSMTSSVNFDDLNKQRQQEILIEQDKIRAQLSPVISKLDAYESQLDAAWAKYQSTKSRNDYEAYEALYAEYLDYYEQVYLPLENQYKALQDEYDSLNPKG